MCPVLPSVLPDFPSFIPFDITNSCMNIGWADDVQVFLKSMLKVTLLSSMAEYFILNISFIVSIQA